MPYRTSAGDQELEACRLRSRVYAWIGFPHGFKHSWFSTNDGTLPPGATLGTMTDLSGPLFVSEVRALAAGLDWTKSEFATLSQDADSVDWAKTLFNQPQFQRPVDGVEVRVHWRYTTLPSTGGSQEQGIDNIFNIV